MSSKDLEKVIKRMDRTFNAAFPKEIDSSRRSNQRATLEIAYQLALLNERLQSMMVPVRKAP